MPVVHMIQKLSCRSQACLPLLREIAWLCACWDVVIECVHIGTKVNKFADCLMFFPPAHYQTVYMCKGLFR